MSFCSRSIARSHSLRTALADRSMSRAISSKVRFLFIAQRQDLPIVLRQALQGSVQRLRLFMGDGLAAGGEHASGQAVGQTDAGTVSFQSHLAVQGSLVGGSVTARAVGQVVQQGAPQPGK